jgi:hypothetical protein
MINQWLKSKGLHYGERLGDAGSCDPRWRLGRQVELEPIDHRHSLIIGGN